LELSKYDRIDLYGVSCLKIDQCVLQPEDAVGQQEASISKSKSRWGRKTLQTTDRSSFTVVAACSGGNGPVMWTLTFWSMPASSSEGRAKRT
jgi:hypothetical protein